MNDYERLEYEYAHSGHAVFMCGFSIFIALGGKAILKDAVSIDDIPGKIFSDEFKLKAIEIAKMMANTPLNVLLAVLQRVVRPANDPHGETIPFAVRYNDIDSICPICGHAVEYSSQYITDEGTVASWECPNCSATGKSAYCSVFDGHFNVRDKNEQPISGRDDD